MDYTQIKVTHLDSVTWITLNRPDKLNALTPTMLVEWIHAMDAAKEDSACRVIVVKGEGRAFSAGVDLSVFQETKVEPGHKMHEQGMQIIETLEKSPIVTIAMVNGFCFTGAMELMMAFDLIYVADEAKIGDTHAKWGIPPKWGMTQRLQRQVGLRKAKELSFTAQTIDGKEAERIGLANKSVPLLDLEKTVNGVIEKIIGNSTQAIGSIKEMYEYGSKHTLGEGIQYELDLEVNFTDKKDDLKDFKNKM